MSRGSLLFSAWVLALGATAGSLFFSEIMNFAPCVLCWYQRLAMFPLAIVLTVANIRNDHGVTFYALPLAGIGAIVAFIHNLLYYGVIPKALSPCTESGPSCTEVHLAIAGFISIPLLSLLGFLVIGVVLLKIHFCSERQ